MRLLVTLLLLGVSYVSPDPCPDPGLEGEAWTVVQRSGYVKITSGQVTFEYYAMASDSNSFQF